MSVFERTDPFASVLGAARGSDRSNPPAPTLSEALRTPWLAQGAADHLCRLLLDGELEQPVAACAPLREQLRALQFHRERRTPADRVLAALIERVCLEAQETWRPHAKGLWRFCGFPDCGKLGVARRVRGARTAWFEALPMSGREGREFKDAHRRALRDALVADRDTRAGSAFTSSGLRTLAVRAYLDGACNRIGEVLGGRRRVNGRRIAGPGDLDMLEVLARALTRSGMTRLRAEFGDYQRRVRANTREPGEELGFEQALAALAPEEWAHCFHVALTNVVRPSPERGLDRVRERRDILRSFIADALKERVALRHPDGGPD